MNKMRVLAVVLAMAFLFVGAASAEMYVEGYIGGSFASNAGQSFSLKETPPTNFIASTSHYKYSGAFDNPQVIGGVKVGTWFVPEGTLGWSGYPSWAKYFGFYTDFSYQNLFVPTQTVFSSFPVNVQVHSEGSVATWAFMFAGRYGFYPDSEVPFGRLQPYVAVGPAVMFSSRDLKIKAQGPAINTGIGLGSTGSTNIALAVDAGIRFMALKNVSFDISFKYRYANPSYNFDNIAGSGVSVDFKPTYNLFSGQVGVAYHF